jgi:hypothetical protein
MNETNPPMEAPAGGELAESPPVIGVKPEDQAPVPPGTMAAVEALLRQPGRVLFHLRETNSRPLITALLFIAIVCSLIYGVVVGTFSGGEQLWAAPVKIAAGLILTALICLPSLYIFSCLSGSQARLADVAGLIAGLLALIAVLLIGFAPIAWVFSASTESVVAMGVLHLVFWAVAFYFGARFLRTGFRNLNARRSGGIAFWLLIFMVVALQMSTALRPIVGRSNTYLPVEKKFFVGHWFDTVAETTKASRAQE